MDDDVDASGTGRNRGGRGKCILGTCIRMKREEFKSALEKSVVTITYACSYAYLVSSWGKAFRANR